MKVQEIPLRPEPQSLQIQLGGIDYLLTLRWNEPEQSWSLDIATALGVALISGIAVVTGQDLVGQYGYLGFTGSLIAQTDNDPDAVPTFTNLGQLGHLYFVTL